MGDLLSAISVLLVFLTFLFNSVEKEVSAKIALRKPDQAQKEARRQFNNELLKLLFLKILPINTIYAVIFYALLPKTVHLITTSNFSLWQFDPFNTIYVFIELGFLGLTIYAMIKAIHLTKKILN